MQKFILQCEYPFWLPGEFLFHTQSRSFRYKIFSEWKDKLKEGENRNDPSGSDVILQSATWELLGFLEENPSTAPRQVSYLPYNIATQKGGVLLGRFSKKELESSKGKATQKAFLFLKSLHQYFEWLVSKTTVLKDNFYCRNIYFELVFYDWSIGSITVAYEIDYKNWKTHEVSHLAEKLKDCFVNKYYDKESFEEFINRYDILKEWIGQIEPDYKLKKFAYQGGWRNPFFVFMERIILSFAQQIPSKKHEDGALIANGQIGDFFKNQIELKQHKPKIIRTLKPFEEGLRLPFHVNNFIFLPETENDYKSLEKKDLQGLVDANPISNQMDNSFSTHPFLDSVIKKTGSGFNGNYMIIDPEVYKSKLKSKSETENVPTFKLKNFANSPETYRTIWLWRIAMIYFGALHRVHGHLVTRKGLHLEAVGMVASGEYSFVNRSVEREIQRLESMRIAIETAIQESSTIFLCDNNYYRNIYLSIQKSYYFDELIQSIRHQTPILIDDLESDNRKKQASSLRSLSYLIWVSLSISAFTVYLKILDIPLVHKIFIEGCIKNPFVNLPNNFRLCFNYFSAFIVLAIFLTIIYYFGQSLVTGESFRGVLKRKAKLWMNRLSGFTKRK